MKITETEMKSARGTESITKGILLKYTSIPWSLRTLIWRTKNGMFRFLNFSCKWPVIYIGEIIDLTNLGESATKTRP